MDGARLVGRWVGGWGCKFRCNIMEGIYLTFTLPYHPTIPQVEVDW
nr:MAG TPA: toxin [Caudoviricetes sp.]